MHISRSLCAAALGSSILACFAATGLAADTDNDGLLDVVDAPGYDIRATGTLIMNGLGIEDLDGVSELSSDLLKLYLGDNEITSIDAGDLTGLNTQYLYFYNNQITEIEPYAFTGITLRDLNLNNNHFSDLHLEGGIYEVFYHLGIDRFDIKRLYLDEAQISVFSYEEVVRETTEITDLSMVGTTFIGDAPETINDILSAAFLDNVTVDRNLFELYESDFNSFAALDGNDLTIIDEVDADCNLSGGLDFSDLACIETIEQRDAVLSELNLRPGDLDGNGTVVFADFIILAKNFGFTSGTYLQGNLNLEDGIGFTDFLILAENFGTHRSNTHNAASRMATAEPVPEPQAVGFLGLAAAVVVLSRSLRRRRPRL